MNTKGLKQVILIVSNIVFNNFFRGFGPFIFVLLLLISSSCADSQLKMAEIPLSKLSFKRGIGYWPANYKRSYQNDVHTILKTGAQIACIQIDDWNEPNNNKHKQDIYSDLLEYARKEGLLTYIAVEPFNGDRSAVRFPKGWKGHAPDAGNKQWQETYGSYILGIVKRHRPDYLNIAVEANMYYRQNPKDWGNFKTFFNRLYHEVKAISPATRVFASYQYEVLRGDFARQKSASQWELFGSNALHQDFIGITSYPLFLQPSYDPDLIPTDYFHELKGKSNLPLFIAEVGYYSGRHVSPASSEANQAYFIKRLPNLLSGLNVEAVCWISVADLPDIPALAPLKKVVPQFFSLGLFDERLKAKPAWEAWLAMKPGAVSQASSPPAKVVADKVDSSFDISGFIGIGSTLSTETQMAGGDRNFVWRYRFSSNPLAMIVHPSIQIPADKKGIEVTLWTKQQTNVAILIEDGSGARYETRIPLSSGVSTNRLFWEGFSLQKENQVPDGRLDITRAKKLILLDLSGFMGKSGENQIMIKKIRMI